MSQQRVQPLRLFAYGSLLPGERDAALLHGCRHLGAARTSPHFRLVDLGLYPALICVGMLSIEGELYEVEAEVLRKLDGAKELGRLFDRRAITLVSGEEAHAYIMTEERVRGRRRLPGTDWRTRFAAKGRRTFR